ncbi:hypothetical protein BV502_02970 [Leucobacter sp. OAMLP11]|uniref:GNAT family N-acetyltransferase n=1 Tax=unclassified Leucobacter TaxID=2621730 RepID=UPI000C1A4E7B|nr:MULTISPECIES: GNAT family N-acetyltransferase [unclassified Leucobacter]PIO51738.1 hypothetical protein BV502_02970 [Leucobacter sp. OAMLP11]
MNSSAFEIRPIRPEEHAVEAELLRRAYAAGPYAADLDGNEAWIATERDTAGRDAAGRVLVAVRAEAPGEVIGAVSVLRGGSPYTKLAAPGEAELRLVAVDPAAQGAGLGAALTRAGTELAMRWGVDAIRLDTGERNPAQHLYAKLGYERTPERDTSLADGGYGGSLTYAYPLNGDSAGPIDASVRVREIRSADVEAVSALVLAAYRDTYEGLDPAYLGEIADVAGRMRDGLVWVAEDRDSGELLGTITTPRPGKTLSDVAHPGELDIRLLGVGAAARGRGIGERLTRLGITLARLRGNSRLVLNTGLMMEPAWRLYERLGFERLVDRERQFTRPDGTVVHLLAYGYDVQTRG